MNRALAADSATLYDRFMTRGKGAKVNGLLLGVTLLGGLLCAGAFAYFYFVHYSRSASNHVPPGATMVARFDAERVLLYGPVRKHLLPLLDLGGTPDPKGRRERIREATGIDVARDIREVVVANGQGSTDLVMIVGGKFSSVNVVRKIAEMFKEEGHPTQLAEDSQILSFGAGKFGLHLAQADDGVLIIGLSEAVVRASLPANDVAESMGLPRSGAGGFALSGSLFDGSSGPARGMLARLTQLSDVKRVVGSVRFEENAILQASLELRDGVSAADLKSRLETLMAPLRLAAGFLPGDDVAGERSMLTRAELTAEESQVVKITTFLEASEIDRGARSLADMVRLAR